MAGLRKDIKSLFLMSKIAVIVNSKGFKILLQGGVDNGVRYGIII
jgi:hypothetical protein